MRIGFNLRRLKASEANVSHKHKINLVRLQEPLYFKEIDMKIALFVVIALVATIVVFVATPVRSQVQTCQWPNHCAI
jgi:hypothetical protein